MKSFDVVVIGAGVYGLMLALNLRRRGMSVCILEKETVGHPLAGSSGLTRVGHSMYDDQEYIQLASTSLSVYRSHYREGIVDCPTVDFSCRDCKIEDRTPYSNRVLAHGTSHHTPLTSDEITERYDSFSGDLYGCVDSSGGIFQLGIIREKLLKELGEIEVRIFPHTQLRIIRQLESGCEVETHPLETIRSQHVVIAAGYTSQQVVDLLEGVNKVDLSIQPTAPGTPIYFKPKTDAQYKAASYTALPAFAFIEHGIFGIPIIPGYTDSVKIAGFYDPKSPNKFGLSPFEFIKKHLPLLQEFEVTIPNTVDHCLYDYTEDGHFIVGNLPNSENISLACGWNGGGYKFAPAVTELLAKLIESGVNDIPKSMSPRRLRVVE